MVPRHGLTRSTCTQGRWDRSRAQGHPLEPTLSSHTGGKALLPWNEWLVYQAHPASRGHSLPGPSRTLGPTGTDSEMESAAERPSEMSMAASASRSSMWLKIQSTARSKLLFLERRELLFLLASSRPGHAASRAPRGRAPCLELSPPRPPFCSWSALHPQAPPL